MLLTYRMNLDSRGVEVSSHAELWRVHESIKQLDQYFEGPPKVAFGIYYMHSEKVDNYAKAVVQVITSRLQRGFQCDIIPNKSL